MDSSLAIYIRPAKDPIPVFKWRCSRKHLSSLQQGCTVARYVTNHFQGRTISLAICSFTARKSSNAIIVQNVTANKGNWKSLWSVPLPLWHKHPVTTRWRGQPGHGKAWLGKGAVKLTDGEVIRGAWVIGFSQSLKIECGWCNSPREWCNVKNVWQTFWDL